MPIFRARVAFAGLRGSEVKRLDRLMRELGGSGGKITVAANSPAGDFPIGSTYLFSNDDHQTASDFSGWLREQLESKIDYPLGLTAERMDDATGLATLTLEALFSAPNRGTSAVPMIVFTPERLGRMGEPFCVRPRSHFASPIKQNKVH